MAKANTSQEPSMEEILASIRRIISDETPPPPPPPAAPAKAAAKPEPAPETVSEDDLDKLFSQEDDSDEPVLDLDPEVEDEDVLELVPDEPSSADDDPLELVEGLMPDEAELSFVDPAAKDEPAEPDTAGAEEDPFADAMVPEPEPEPVVAAAPPPPPKPAAKVRPEPAPVIEADEPMTLDEPLVSRRTTESVNAAFGSLSHTILSNNAKTLDDLVKEMLRPMLKVWLDENLPGIVERLVRAEIERVSRGR
ncbi:PopZ family protein [Chthonobacter rhizosphaerae]|uniref:PopZ family protein n=1 Tax=Chthonobacter rhizosphaerae TaxID=2735553 RepID=UPI0015EEC57D|nr:DUF2497 domain-containing protein [Chthonobacter rhizosphaerae]